MAGDQSGVNPKETILSQKPITEDTFKYKDTSKADIKEKPLITINITPYLSSGNKLHRTINEKELPLDQVVTNIIEHTNNGITKIKTVQIYPESILEMSDNAETIKQTTNGRLKLELYYGYQKTSLVPWEKYSRVDSCDDTQCRVVYADFNSHKVWIEIKPLSEINNMVTVGNIPEFNGVLP